MEDETKKEEAGGFFEMWGTFSLMFCLLLPPVAMKIIDHWFQSLKEFRLILGIFVFMCTPFIYLFLMKSRRQRSRRVMKIEVPDCAVEVEKQPEENVEKEESVEEPYLEELEPDHEDVEEFVFVEDSETLDIEELIPEDPKNPIVLKKLMVSCGTQTDRARRRRRRRRRR